MTHEQNSQRVYKRSADRPWFVWWGIEPAKAEMFRYQLLTYAIFLRDRIQVLSAKATANKEVWTGLRRIADEKWRTYRLRCETIEAATLYNNYHNEPGKECLKTAQILVRCFDDAIRSTKEEATKLRADIDWLQRCYMGELLRKLRVIYCPLEITGHPLDLAFWHITPSLGIGVDVSVFKQQDHEVVSPSRPKAEVTV
jgi:hypothetical protein